MANLLIVTEDFFRSPQAPACCLFSGTTENLRVQEVKIDRDSLTRQCLIYGVVTLATFGLGLIWLLLMRRILSLPIACERRAEMRWRMCRNLGLYLLISGSVLGFGLAAVRGDVTILGNYFSAPRGCGCATFGIACIQWLFGTPGGWITLGGFGAGFLGLCVAQAVFYVQSVTLRLLGTTGEVEIHFPDAHEDTYRVWRDAFIVYTKAWNEAHDIQRQDW